MVADLIFTNPYNANNMFGTDAQNDRYVAYAVLRYAAYHNVMWNLCWEWTRSPAEGGTYPQDQADFNRIGDLVHNSDPWMAASARASPVDDP